MDLCWAANPILSCLSGKTCTIRDFSFAFQAFSTHCQAPRSLVIHLSHVLSLLSCDSAPISVSLLHESSFFSELLYTPCVHSLISTFLTDSLLSNHSSEILTEVTSDQFQQTYAMDIFRLCLTGLLQCIRYGHMAVAFHDIPFSFSLNLSNFSLPGLKFTSVLHVSYLVLLVSSLYLLSVQDLIISQGLPSTWLLMTHKSINLGCLTWALF